MHGTKRSTNDSKVGGTRLRPVLGGGVGLAALVAILVLAAPLTSAHGTVTFTAPYTGFSSTPYLSTAVTHCGYERTSTPPNWTLSNGEFQYAGSARTAACGTGAYAYTDGVVVIDSTTFHAPSAGAGAVQVDLSSAFSARAVLHLGVSNVTGNGSAALVEVDLYVSLAVYEIVHNGTQLFGGTSIDLVDLQLSTTSGTLSASQNWTTSVLNASGAFVSGHSYEAVISIGATVFAEGNAGTTTTSATLNAAGTDGVKITSITAL